MSRHDNVVSRRISHRSGALLTVFVSGLEHDDAIMILGSSSSTVYGINVVGNSVRNISDLAAFLVRISPPTLLCLTYLRAALDRSLIYTRYVCVSTSNPAPQHCCPHDEILSTLWGWSNISGITWYSSNSAMGCSSWTQKCQESDKKCQDSWHFEVLK